MGRILLVVLVVVLSGCTSVGEVRTLGRYDFSYRIEGDGRAAPLQIFDDGTRTFLQFRNTLPGIFAVDGESEPGVLTIRREGPYVVVDRIEREFVFALDHERARASARYIGTQNRALLPHELAARSEPVPAPHVAPLPRKVPFAKGSSRLTADGRRTLEELLAGAKAAARIAILDRPARARRDRGVGHARSLAVRAWLVRREVDANRIVIVKESAVAADYCAVLFDPPGVTTMGRARPADAQAPGPVSYGAAKPSRVSLPAQPVFVDPRRSGGTRVDRSVQ